MRYSRLLGLGLALGSLTFLIAAEHDEVQTLNLPGVDWHARAGKWFKSEDKEDRKAQMKEASRAVKRPCKYCHTEDFEGFTDKKELGQQMMAVAAEAGVECKDCHDGRDKMTEMGEKAEKMWDLSREKGVWCDKCHQPNTKFKELTADGKKQKEEWDAQKKAGGAPVATPPSAPVPAPATTP